MTRVVLLHATSPDTPTLSYRGGWLGAFLQSPQFECTAIDVTQTPALAVARAAWGRFLRRAEAVVILHSVFSNTCYLRGPLLELVARLNRPKAYFISNEYKLMPDKMSFCERVDVTMLVSQSTLPAVLAEYRRRLPKAIVTGIPNAGVDPSTFAPRTAWRERPIDIGYRSFAGPLYLGHLDRTEIAERVSAVAERRGARIDISVDPLDRFAGAYWASFLDQCKAQLACEAGNDYFEVTDATRNAVNDFLADHPDAAFEDVHARFFAPYPNPISGRILTARITEAAATKTVQLGVEGDYAGYFAAGEHYIPIRKDFSNVEEAVATLDDEDACTRIADNAYRVATEELTYERLVGRFHVELAAVT